MVTLTPAWELAPSTASPLSVERTSRSRWPLSSPERVAFRSAAPVLPMTEMSSPAAASATVDEPFSADATMSPWVAVRALVTRSPWSTVIQRSPGALRSRSRPEPERSRPPLVSTMMKLLVVDAPKFGFRALVVKVCPVTE